MRASGSDDLAASRARRILSGRGAVAGVLIRGLLVALGVATLAEGVVVSAPAPAGKTGTSSAISADLLAAGAPSGWVTINYGTIVDRRRLSHSGESVGMLLKDLAGRPVPASGERPEDAIAHINLDPLLEPYAFLLPDTVDTIAPASQPPMIEIGRLWQPGEAQPAWAELLRARRYLVESDGEGRLRVFLPWTPISAQPLDGSVLPLLESAGAAKEAYEEAWPILRHVFAAERRRLAKRAGDSPEAHTLEVLAFAYAHYPARTLFQLGVRPWRALVDATNARADAASLDLALWQKFLDRGLRFEGGRLESDGAVDLMGSEAPARPTLLGRALSLADFAVAYRAVFHGGAGEPYMSLDRGASPQTMLVNYGGRLQDTALGFVSLLCDIRFKTFSLGLDILAASDVRESLRRDIPSFRTHLERFAADARSQTVTTQQTRLWFYPDTVDLTLSPQGDILVMRRARMSAASERVQQETHLAGGQADPPWTKETVTAINADYDAFARVFPEMGDLDQVVRLLSFFTWLRQEKSEGAAVPDLDALLALELPAMPTPRRFPQLLTAGAMPVPGKGLLVDVFDREPVGEALDRLLPDSGPPLAALERFHRALASLDRSRSDHAALAKELETVDPGGRDESDLDLDSYRAERLRLHQLSFDTLPASQRSVIETKRSAGNLLRTFSMGIGGLDLGMSPALARASRRGSTLRFASLGSAGAEPGAAGSFGAGPSGQIRREESSPVRGAEEPPGGSGRRLPAGAGESPTPGAGLPTAAQSAGEGRGGAPGSTGSKRGILADSTLLPPTLMPDHGLGSAKAVELKGPVSGPPAGSTQEKSGGAQAYRVALREFAGGWAETGESVPGGPVVAWVQTALGADGPDPRSRRLILDDSRRASTIERVEDQRFLRYTMQIEGSRVRPLATTRALPSDAASLALGPGRPRLAADRTSSGGGRPAGLMTMEIVPPDRAKSAGAGLPGASSSEDPGRPAEGDSSAPQSGAAGEESASLRLRLTTSSGSEREASIPRSTLQRLVLGKIADLTPERPLSGLSPAEKILGDGRGLLVMMDPPRAVPPWAGVSRAAPGEEDPARLASGLAGWWAAERGGGPAPGVAVGTDPGLSPERWQRVAGIGTRVLIQIPDDAFPGPSSELRQRLSDSIKDSVSKLSPSEPPSLLVLVSAEDPALLARRVRSLARQPEMKGRLVAVWPLGGPLRPDMPASLLAEGNLAAIGVAPYSPVGGARVVSDLEALAKSLKDPSIREKRPEQAAPIFLWYY